jgi:hypothetical protein
MAGSDKKADPSQIALGALFLGALALQLTHQVAVGTRAMSGAGRGPGPGHRLGLARHAADPATSVTALSSLSGLPGFLNPSSHPSRAESHRLPS